MSALATLAYQLRVLDTNGVGAGGVVGDRCWVPATALKNGQRQPITLTASVFTTITVPTGAKYVCLILGSATQLTLKGVTGDTGIPLTPTSNPLGVDAHLPLNGVATFGILNGLASNQTIEAYFL